MINSTQRHAASDVMYLWLACALALCAGWYIAVFRLGGAIDVQHELNHQATALMRDNAQILGERVALERRLIVYDRAIAPLDLSADRATTVARFLRHCARIATIEHVRLVQVDERVADPSSVRTPQSATEAAFESIAMDVTLTGTYGNLLLTVRDLTQAPLAMNIEIDALESAGKSAGPATSPDLTARMRVSLLRLADAKPASAVVIAPTEEPLHARFP